MKISPLWYQKSMTKIDKLETKNLKKKKKFLTIIIHKFKVKKNKLFFIHFIYFKKKIILIL